MKYAQREVLEALRETRRIDEAIAALEESIGYVNVQLKNPKALSPIVETARILDLVKA